MFQFKFPAPGFFLALSSGLGYVGEVAKPLIVDLPSNLINSKSIAKFAGFHWLAGLRMNALLEVSGDSSFPRHAMTGH